jgi:hypothetical protein
VVFLILMFPWEPFGWFGISCSLIAFGSFVYLIETTTTQEEREYFRDLQSTWEKDFKKIK